MIREITCEEASRYVYRYLDGELKPRTRTEFQNHLETCRLCMGATEFERSMIDLVRALGASERPPDGLRDRIRKVLEQVNDGDGGDGDGE